MVVCCVSKENTQVFPLLSSFLERNQPIFDNDESLRFPNKKSILIYLCYVEELKLMNFPPRYISRPLHSDITIAGTHAAVLCPVHINFPNPLLQVDQFFLFNKINIVFNWTALYITFSSDWQHGHLFLHLYGPQLDSSVKPVNNGTSL